MRSYPSGTVTFLFTDVEGSTRRWEADSAAMLSAIERHFELLDEAVNANNGVRFKTIGDAIQAAFPTPLEAALAAVAAQRAILTMDWGEVGPLQVRMALHTGTAAPRDGDYLAPSLNRLARLLSAGAGGQILVTEATRNLLRDTLPPEIQLIDLGEHQLRDLREAEHVYQIAAEGLPATFPPLRSLTRPTNNLPTELTTFVGRQREIDDVCRRLSAPAVRLLTLTGPGGTGKTRLSLRVATDLIEQYPDGVWFVALAPIAGAERVAAAIAETLGVREIPGETVKQALLAYLRGRHLLLILDNFEHVVDAAPLVSEVLANCPSVKILVTSRAPLRIAGEQEMPIMPLGLPESVSPERVDDALASEAVRLFVDRVQAIRGDFVLDERNVAVVTAICQRLDGLPLAIELAAARVRLLSLEAILARLDDRLSLLTGGGRDRPERQQTLRAAVAWSHDLLNPEEQAFFRRLAVFTGGWTLEAAEAVAGSTEPVVSAIDDLASLNDNSLVHQSSVHTTTGDDGLRFGMLQTIQEFAMQQLVQSGESEPTRDAHAAFFLGLATDAAPNLTGPSAVSWLDRLDVDHDNLLAALAWLQERDDAVRAVELAAALWRFWWLRGHISEGRSRLETALNLGAPDDATFARAVALDGAGVLAETQGDYERAELFHQQALALSRSLDDRVGVARALGNLGIVAFDRGDHAGATARLEESLTLAREVGDHYLVATALNDLGLVAYSRGDLKQAQSLHQESLDLRRRLGSGSEIARSLNNLGFIAYDLGEFGQARRFFEESLELYRSAGDKWGAAGPLVGLAAAIQSDGDNPRATALYEESLALFLETGDTRNVAAAHQNLANSARLTGALTRALAHYRDALIGYRAVDDRAGIRDALAGIGGILIGDGQFQAAVRFLGAASRIAEAEDSYRGHEASERFEADVAAARAALDASAFADAWEGGRDLSLDAAVAEAEQLSITGT